MNKWLGAAGICVILDGKPTTQDPDGLIYEVAWKTAEQLKQLQLSFPEDKVFLLNYIKRKN